MTHAPGIPVRRKILYLGVVVVAFLGLAEGAVRVRAWLKYGAATPAVRDPMLIRDERAELWVPRPGYEVKGASLHIRINTLGFRGNDISPTKAPGTFRIVCLGASTTFSAEVSSNQATWPHRLQEKLQAAFPDRRIEVINAAVPGYVAADNLKNLTHRVLPLDPDLVIYYEANNEIVKDTQALAVREGLLDEGRGRQPVWITALSRVSLLFDLAYKNVAILARSRSGSARTIDRVPSDLPNGFIGTLDAMRSQLAERSIPLVLSTFIVKYRHGQDRATQIANADVAFYYMPWMSIEGMLDAMDVYNQAILDYAARAALPVVDDRDAIPPDASHFADCMHLSDGGNEAMAERFFRFLRARGLVDRAAASGHGTTPSVPTGSPRRG